MMVRVTATVKLLESNNLPKTIKKTTKTTANSWVKRNLQFVPRRDPDTSAHPEPNKSQKYVICSLPVTTCLKKYI